jgi:hypothetical protein
VRIRHLRRSGRGQTEVRVTMRGRTVHSSSRFAAELVLEPLNRLAVAKFRQRSDGVIDATHVSGHVGGSSPHRTSRPTSLDAKPPGSNGPFAFEIIRQGNRVFCRQMPRARDRRRKCRVCAIRCVGAPGYAAYSIGLVPIPPGSRPASTHPMRVAATGMAITMRKRFPQGMWSMMSDTPPSNAFELNHPTSPT